MSTLETYVVYNNTKDYPLKYVCRIHRVISEPGKEIRQEPGELVGCEDTLDSIRAKIPRGKYCLPRLPEDDPVIVETWI